MEIQRQIITNYGILRGIIHIPNIQHPKGTIIIIHGYFSSQKIGPARFYVQLGRLFENLGYCVYRFDAYGVGDSDGEYSEVTLESHKRDILSIIDDIIKSQYNYELILCGHSSGCNIALLIVPELKFIKKLILISPAFGAFSGKEKLLSKDEIYKLNLGQTIFRKGLPINKKYIEQIKNEKILFTEKSLSIETIIFIGKIDQFYNTEYIYNKSTYFKNYKLFIIDLADHNFIDPISREELFNNLKLLL